jgi:hypothetical protein
MLLNITSYIHRLFSYISIERLLHQETEYSGGPVKMRPDLSCMGSSTAIQESSLVSPKRSVAWIFYVLLTVHRDISLQ